MQRNHPITGVTAAIALCAALSAVAGTVQAQVNRCVDADGRVTLTDDSCPRQSRAVNHDVSDDGAVGLVVTSGPQATHLAGGGLSGNRADADNLAYPNNATDAVNPDNVADAANLAAASTITTGLTRSRWADLPRPLVRKAAGTDAVTLQTARTTLQLRDEARRQSRMLATR